MDRRDLPARDHQSRRAPGHRSQPGADALAGSSRAGSESRVVGPTGDRFRILQVHPTRRCNLRCLHCYSTSGPEHRDALALAVLRDAVRDAAAEGFNVASFSGGEPLMYSELPQLLDAAHECGLLTAAVTNGMLLGRRRLEELRGRLDLVAIRLDGVPS